VIESLSGKEYARYYLHGEHLIIDGKTMSKSRGNIRYPEDMLNKHVKPRHLRFFLIYTHYRRKLNLTDKRFQEAAGYVDSIRRLIRKLVRRPASDSEADPGSTQAVGIIESIRRDFEAGMNDDLSVGKAIDGIHGSLQRLEHCCFPLTPASAGKLSAELSGIDNVLQVLMED
jgi:cysteinyl-tRNA synthetase